MMMLHKRLWVVLILHFLIDEIVFCDNSSGIEFPIQSYCLCDLNTNVCDIDCCCDEDCESEDIESFFDCQNKSQPFDQSKYCGPSTSGLFCLVQKEDFPPEYELFRTREPITNVKDFDRIMSRHAYFGPRNHFTRSRIVSHYQPGDLVLGKYKEDVVGGLYVLPNMPVIYLDKDEATFTTYASYNASSFIPKEVLIHPNDSQSTLVTAWSLCSHHEDHVDCLDTEPLELIHPNEYSSLFMEVLHHGINGIKEITVVLKKRDKPSLQNSLTLGYYHRLWKRNSTSNTLMMVKRRSGNPGYIIGRPLVVSLRESNSTSRRLDDGLEFYGLFPSGFCDDPSRRKISLLFGENILSGCELVVKSLNCSEIYQRMSQIFYFDIENLLIGSFGNTDVKDEDEWIRLFSINNFESLEMSNEASAECLVPRSLHIEVLYSNTGSFSDPQRKIIGCVFRYAIPEDIQEFANVPILISASFIDVSEPSVAKFAEFPVIEAKFPRDFFYPFFISFAIKIDLSVCLWIQCMLLVFLK